MKINRFLVILFIVFSTLVVGTAFSVFVPSEAFAEGEIMVASVQDTSGAVQEFATLDQAIVACDSDSTVTLLSSATISDIIGKSFTLDVNGNSLTSETDITIENSSIKIINGNSVISNLLFKGNVTLSSSSFQAESGYISGSDYKFSLGDNSVFQMSSVSTAQVDVPVSVDSASSSVSINGGTVNSVHIYENASVFISENANIGELKIYTSAQKMLKSGAKIRVISFENQVKADYKSLLYDGCIYRNQSTSQNLKSSEMDSGISVEIVACTHDFVTTDYFCEYCGKQMIVQLTRASASSVVYFPYFSESLSNLSDGDTIKILRNIDLITDVGTDFTIAGNNMTLDLNGKSLSGYYVGVVGTTTITNSSNEGGNISLSVTYSSNITFDDTNSATTLSIMATGGSLKVYSGFISRITFYNNYKLEWLLPEGRAIIQTDDNHKMTYEEILSNSARDNLRVVSCTHEIFDDELICLYCNKKVDLDAVGRALNKAKQELESAKNELNEAIKTKADDETISQKISALEQAIKDAETLSETFATDSDNALKDELNASIESAKNEAINTAKSSISDAVTKLENVLSEKANAEDVASSISTLEQAIKNAETLSKTFATDSDKALKDELNASIESAKSEAINSAKSSISDAVTKLENILSEKANAEDVASSISTLEQAIKNAETLSKTFATDSDKALKDELNASIESAKNEALLKANEALQENVKLKERVDELELNANRAQDSLQSLKIAVIVCSVILFVSVITIGVFFVLGKIKKRV